MRNHQVHTEKRLRRRVPERQQRLGFRRTRTQDCRQGVPTDGSGQAVR